MTAQSIKKLEALVLSGRDEKNRTLENFAKIIAEMEHIDPKAAPKDILTAIIHFCFRYRAEHLPSELEDLSHAPGIQRIFNYPKDDPNRRINQQLRINPELRRTLDILRYDIKRWKLVHHPKDGKLVNIDHACAALDCYIRQGRAKAELYSFGGDILKKIKNFFVDDEKGKTQEQLRQQRGSLSADDWAGDILGETLILVYKVQKDKKGAQVKLSNVLQEAHRIFQKPHERNAPTQGILRNTPVRPPPRHASPIRNPLGASPIQKQQEQQRVRQQQLLQELRKRNRSRTNPFALPGSRQEIPGSRLSTRLPQAHQSRHALSSPSSAVGFESHADRTRRRNALEASRVRIQQPFTHTTTRPSPTIRNQTTRPPIGARVTIGEPYYMHTVAPGDTLSGIARNISKDARRWREIHHLNPHIGKNPHLIRPGQRLRVPLPHR